jgi:hypothetical protein
MAKVLEFSSRGLTRKDKPITERVTLGKLIEFPKPKPVNKKTAQAITPAPFFGCF